MIEQPDRLLRLKIAFFFRYSPADHTELSPAVPALVKRLAQQAEVHYFGMNSRKPTPPDILTHARLHLIPINVDRSSSSDKLFKMLLWYLCLPWLALRCRWQRFDAVYFNDYLPLGAWIIRIFYGPKFAYWVADFLHQAYAEKVQWLKPVANLIDQIDFAAWRRVPLIFTHAKATIPFLARQGIAIDRIVPIHDPCDTEQYKPADRITARQRWNYRRNDFVLVHHGILHPNKGLDRIIRAMAPVMKQDPSIHLLIVGSGPQLMTLKEMAVQFGVEPQVRFTGWLESLSDVNLALNAGDVGLVMRTGGAYDDFHTTSALVHNMAAGLAVLSARRGGMAEVLTDGINGFMFNPDDMDEFMQRLMELKANPTQRDRFGRAARQLACELFSIDSVVERISVPLLRLARGS